MKQLYVVSTGPGDPGLLAPLAKQAIEQSTDLVAYGLYLDILGALVQGKKQHDLPLGQEIERARLALNLAGEGKTTALISSGDIGIYAMATLVFELLDRAQQQQNNDSKQEYTHWMDIDIQVIPGISAMQAAAAKIGASLGHDFCTISLSDLLTPWAVIEKRIKAAAEADFVISFYNPVSKKRRWQLKKAQQILLEHRAEDTPVILAKNLSRDGEDIKITTLEQLSIDDVDMLTLVQIGNSNTRQFKTTQQQWVYTPRGYEKKMESL